MLSVHWRVAQFVLDKLLRALRADIQGISVDGYAVCATALWGILTYARRLHERLGRDGMAVVGR